MITPPSRDELEAYREIPKEKVITTYVELMKTGETGLAHRLRCYASYWHRDLFMFFYMAKWATAPFKDYHVEILHAIPHGVRDRRINILAPRGSAKSTMCALVYPLHRILYAPFDQVMGYDIDKFIIIITVSEGKMKARLRDIMRPLADKSSYPAIHDDFGDRSKDTMIWSSAEFHARLGINDEIGVVRGMSRGKEVRGELEDGSRPTLFIIDDIDSVEDLLNPQSREKDQDWFLAGVMQAGIPEMSNFIMIDTLKHEESLAALNRERPAWETIFLRAFNEPEKLRPHATAEHLWEEWENIYTNLSLKSRRNKADAFYEEHKEEMLEGVDGLWPERITYRLVRSKILDEGYDFTMREYQNDISLTSFRMFDMGNASIFTVQDDGFWVEDERLEDGMRHVKWKDLCGVSIYHDWAGGQEISKNDFSAIVMVAWSKKTQNVDEEDVHDTMNGQYGYVLGAILERSPPDRQIASIFDLADHAMDTLVHIPNFVIHIGYEEIIDGTGRANPDYKRNFMREREKRGKQFHQLTIQSIPQGGVKKETRINTLAGPINFGWLSFNQNLSHEFRRQISMYPTADHDDAPDALEGATKMRLRPTEIVEQRRPNEYQEQGLRLNSGGRW